MGRSRTSSDRSADSRWRLRHLEGPSDRARAIAVACSTWVKAVSLGKALPINHQHSVAQTGEKHVPSGSNCASAARPCHGQVRAHRAAKVRQVGGQARDHCPRPVRREAERLPRSVLVGQGGQRDGPGHRLGQRSVLRRALTEAVRLWGLDVGPRQPPRRSTGRRSESGRTPTP